MYMYIYTHIHIYEFTYICTCTYIPSISLPLMSPQFKGSQQGGTIKGNIPAGSPLTTLARLQFNVSQAADGSWSGEWDEWDLLVTSAHGGRHLMGSLDVEVIFVGRCVLALMYLYISVYLYTFMYK